MDKRDEVLRAGKQSLELSDIASYTTVVRYPEISKHNLISLSPQAIMLAPYQFENSHLTADIKWRDGGLHEELAVAKINGRWNYKISVSDGETGKSLLRCRDANYPSPEVLPACFPKFTTSPVD